MVEQSVTVQFDKSVDQSTLGNYSSSLDLNKSNSEKN